MVNTNMLIKFSVFMATLKNEFFAISFSKIFEK